MDQFAGAAVIGEKDQWSMIFISSVDRGGVILPLKFEVCAFEFSVFFFFLGDF